MSKSNYSNQHTTLSNPDSVSKNFTLGFRHSVLEQIIIDRDTFNVSFGTRYEKNFVLIGEYSKQNGYQKYTVNDKTYIDNDFIVFVQFLYARFLLEEIIDPNEEIPPPINNCINLSELQCALQPPPQAPSAQDHLFPPPPQQDSSAFGHLFPPQAPCTSGPWFPPQAPCASGPWFPPPPPQISCAQNYCVPPPRPPAPCAQVTRARALSQPTSSSKITVNDISVSGIKWSCCGREFSGSIEKMPHPKYPQSLMDVYFYDTVSRTTLQELVEFLNFIESLQ